MAKNFQLKTGQREVAQSFYFVTSGRDNRRSSVALNTARITEHFSQSSTV
jgi:hypothetical protein